MDVRSSFLVDFFFAFVSIYMCEGGFAGGYWYPVVCTIKVLLDYIKSRIAI